MYSAHVAAGLSILFSTLAVIACLVFIPKLSVLIDNIKEDLAADITEINVNKIAIRIIILHSSYPFKNLSDETWRYISLKKTVTTKSSDRKTRQVDGTCSKKNLQNFVNYFLKNSKDYLRLV